MHLIIRIFSFELLHDSFDRIEFPASYFPFFSDVPSEIGKIRHCTASYSFIFRAYLHILLFLSRRANVRANIFSFFKAAPPLTLPDFHDKMVIGSVSKYCGHLFTRHTIYCGYSNYFNKRGACVSMYIIKKDGTKEPFNVQKVVAAVNKSAERVLYTFTPESWILSAALSQRSAKHWAAKASASRRCTISSKAHWT